MCRKFSEIRKSVYNLCHFDLQRLPWVEFMRRGNVRAIPLFCRMAIANRGIQKLIVSASPLGEAPTLNEVLYSRSRRLRRVL